MGVLSLTLPTHIAQVQRPRILRYSVTVLILMIVGLLNVFLNSALTTQDHFLLYVIAIILSSWYGGLACGVLATIVSFSATVFGAEIIRYTREFVPYPLPSQTTFIENLNSSLQPIIFITEGLLISLLIHLMQKVKQEAIQNQQHYRDLAESIPQIVWTAKPDGTIDYHNQRWDEFLGSPSKITKISDLRILLHPDDIPVFDQLWNDSITKAEVLTHEHRMNDNQDKTYRWHLTRIIPLFDEKYHTLQKWIGTSTDIHDQKRSESSQRFLLRASNILSSSLDYQATLTSVARLAVPHIADWCTIDILEEKGAVEQIAVAHREVEKNQILAKLHGMGFSLTTLAHYRQSALDLDKPILVPRITETWLRDRIKDKTQLKLLLEAGISSYMIVPLITQNSVIGTITFISGTSNRHYDESDLEIAEELARRAALAVDNARLYQAAQEEIRERMLAEERMTHQANHDILTGLPNRSLLGDRLNQAIKEAKRKNGMFAVLFVDLDHFKNINDTLGHQIGDTFLQEISGRLQKCIRDEDTVARFGGDEFIILLNDIKNPHDPEIIARKVFKFLAEPFYHDEQEISIQASIGISMYPLDGTDSHTLLKKSDAALYQAKEKGRNIYQMYNQDLEQISTVRFNIENRIIKGFNQEEFFLEYQPVFNTQKEIMGAEALMRWEHPQLGRVSPIDFIPIAEDIGLIIPLEEWVLNTLSRVQEQWHKEGITPVPIAMNISLRHLAHPDFVEIFEKMAQDKKIDPAYIKVEITESAFMQNMEENIRKLEQLKKLGFSIALDDFGTGYSSLNHLKRFPIDILKIDRSFISHCTSDPLDAAIVEAIIAMAHTLNLKVIAEGIETQDQFTYLKNLSCDYIQGNLLSNPVSLDKFSDLLTKK